MKSVFVSSTSIDLKQHRAAVRDAVMSLGMHPVMMDYFPAMDANAVETCKQKVVDSDIYLGIYAHRYGYVPQDQTKSITEMEFDWATEQKIPRHIFVVKPDYEWPEEFIDEDETALNVFKARVGKQLVWTLFTTPDSLAREVTSSLSQDLKDFSSRERKQRNLIIRGGGLIAILLLLIIGAIVNSSYVSPVRQANQESTNAAQAALNNTATASQWTPTPTPTPQPLARAANKLNVVVAGFGYQGSDNHIIQCETAKSTDDIAFCKTADAINDVIADSIRSLPDIGQV